MLVYQIRNISNNKSYVGKTVETTPSKRWYQHLRESELGSQCGIHRAIRKYGPENFDVWVLSHATDLEHLVSLEKFFIRQLRTNNRRYGYNMTPGGDGFHGTHSLKTRKLMSRAHRGKRWVMSERGRLNISKAHRGIRLSRKHRERISKGSTGKKMSEEFKRKLSKFMKGRKVALGCRWKMSKEGRQGCRRGAIKRYAKLRGLRHGQKR